MIDAKAKHRQVRQIEEAPKGAQVIDLMEALRKSVGKNSNEKTKGRKPAKKSRRKAA